MITKGALVKRVSNSSLTHIDRRILADEYPPEGSICVVITSPKDRDLSHQSIYRNRWSQQGLGVVGLKKAVDVMSENKLYKNCEILAFIKVK